MHKLLENPAEYRRWAESTFADFDPRKDRRKCIAEHAPKEFPAIAVLRVSSWGYQEERPTYIYSKEARSLLRAPAAELADRALSSAAELRLAAAECRAAAIELRSVRSAAAGLVAELDRRAAGVRLSHRADGPQSKDRPCM